MVESHTDFPRETFVAHRLRLFRVARGQPFASFLFRALQSSGCCVTWALVAASAPTADYREFPRQYRVQARQHEKPW